MFLVSAKRAHFNFHFPLGVECSSWGTPSYLLNRLCWRPPPTPPAPALFKHGPQTLPLAYLIFAPLLELLLKNGCKNISAGVTEFKKKYFSTISFYILKYKILFPKTDRYQSCSGNEMKCHETALDYTKPELGAQ